MSHQGDARYDIQNAIHGQDPSVDILVCDATVQGADAPTSIAIAIHHLDREQDVDTMIAGRGGGSDTDLQAFDSEQVAEAIFTANTPVVTAVGHTEDRTIADQVADRAAITPTEAGESVLESPAEFIAGTVEPREQELKAGYRAFERGLEHEAKLERAMETGERHRCTTRWPSRCCWCSRLSSRHSGWGMI